MGSGELSGQENVAPQDHGSINNIRFSNSNSRRNMAFVRTHNMGTALSTDVYKELRRAIRSTRCYVHVQISITWLR